jgi:hypothetical protein
MLFLRKLSLWRIEMILCFLLNQLIFYKTQLIVVIKPRNRIKILKIKPNFNQFDDTFKIKNTLYFTVNFTPNFTKP